MIGNSLVLCWSRPVPGREKQSVEFFSEVTSYLTKQQQTGRVKSFTPVLLDSPMGHVGGMIVVQGDTNGLLELQREETFLEHHARASVYLMGYGMIEGAVGDVLQKRMQRYSKHV